VPTAGPEGSVTGKVGSAATTTGPATAKVKSAGFEIAIATVILVVAALVIMYAVRKTGLPGRRNPVVTSHYMPTSLEDESSGDEGEVS